MPRRPSDSGRPRASGYQPASGGKTFESFSLVRGTAPKENYGGRVMCFLETGHGKATVLRFDYEHPPAPPTPSPVWHWAKWALNRLYWHTVPKDRFPDNLPLPIPMGQKETWR